MSNLNYSKFLTAYLIKFKRICLFWLCYEGVSNTTTTPLHCSGTFTGCESPSASSIDWPYLFFVAVTTLRLSTCRGTYTGSLTTTPGDACDRQRHTSWWYLGRGSAPSAIVRLELPALVCGMIYHLPSSLRHHWRCSRRI